MISIRNIKLKGVGVYTKDTSLDLSKTGIYFVSGLNKDSKIKTSNFAGKSLLFTPISQCLFSTLPISYNRKKVSGKRDIIEGYAGVSLYVDDTHLDITQYKNGYKILIDGKDKTPRTIPLCEELIENNIPIGVDDYFTYGYVSSTGSFPILYGSPVERFNYLSNMFDFDLYDKVKVYFNNKKKDYETKLNSLERYKEEYDNAKLEIAKIDIEEIKSKIKEYEEKEKDLKVKYKKLIDEIDKLNTLRGILNAIDKDKKELDYIKTQINKLSKYKEFVNIDIEGLYKDKLNYIKLKEDLKVVKHKLKENEYDKDKYEILKDKYYSYKSLLKNYEKLIKINSNKCPTCGNILEIDKIKKEYSKIKSKLEKISDSFIEMDNKVNQYNKYKGKYKLIKNQIDTLKKELLEYKEVVEQLDEETIRLTNKLKGAISRKEYIKESFERNKEILNSKYKGLSYNKEDYIDKVNKRDSFNKKLNKLINLKGDYVLRYKEYTNLKEKISKYKVEIENYDKVKKEYERVLKIHKIVSTKQVKQEALKTFMKVFDENLNHYASMIFPTNEFFETEIVKDKVIIRIFREDKSYDVRYLSGAESKLFILSVIPSIISMIPDNKKLDFIILDEMDANMNKDLRNYLYNYYIPALNKLIPKVVFVTPQTFDLNYDYFHVNIIKENGSSQVRVE